MGMYKNLRVKGEPIVNILSQLQLPDQKFKKKIALVTGGARGFGKELVIGLASLGAKVYFIDTSHKEGLLLQEECNLKKYAVKFILGDITDFTYMEVILEKIFQEEGSIDFLINNAVHFIVKSIEKLSIEEWQYTHNTNTTAPLFFIKQLLPKMKKKGFGTIVNLIAVEGMAYASAMSSPKASCRSLTISLAAELENEENITVLGYAPGLMDTPLVFEYFPDYCNRLNYDFNDFVLNIINNPGYNGLIPSSHSAASLLWHIEKGSENHGLICTPYLPLHEAGIINLKDKYLKQNVGEKGNITQSNQYIVEIEKYQKVIENKIEIRTKQLKQEKVRTTKLLNDLQQHSRDLELLNTERGNLLKEIHHRVKNNMQIITSLLRIQSNMVEDNTTKSLLKQSQSRIMAMATVHEVLYRSDNYSAIDYEGYLKQLWHYLHKSMVNSNNDIHFEVNAKHVKLSLDSSIILGLIINEVLTNSLKHAFIDHNEGKIYIRFIPSKEYQFHLQIGDNGLGFSNKCKKESNGLGLQLIYDLVSQLNGKIDIDNSAGTHYYIQFNDSL